MTTILWGGPLVILAGLVGGFVGYMVVVGVFSLLEGLGMPNKYLVDAHPWVPRLGAIVGAGIAIMGLVFLFEYGAGFD